MIVIALYYLAEKQSVIAIVVCGLDGKWLSFELDYMWFSSYIVYNMNYEVLFEFSDL